MSSAMIKKPRFRRASKVSACREMADGHIMSTRNAEHKPARIWTKLQFRPVDPRDVASHTRGVSYVRERRIVSPQLRHVTRSRPGVRLPTRPDIAQIGHGQAGLSLASRVHRVRACWIA